MIDSFSVPAVTLPNATRKTDHGTKRRNQAIPAGNADASDNVSNISDVIRKRATRCNYPDARRYAGRGGRSGYQDEGEEVKKSDRLTEREIELLEGMISVQERHAERCDTIANRRMAEKQRGWNLERVELLNRILKVMGPEK